MTIGKAYESTKIEVQECSANRPPAKESIKAVSKNKPKKVLMCNVPAKWEIMAFQAKKTRPHLGSSLQKVKDQKSFSRPKDRSKKCKQFQKGIQEKHSDHKQSKSSTKQFVLRVEEDGEDSLLWSSWQNLCTQPENCDHFCKPTILLSVKKRIPVS